MSADHEAQITLFEMPAPRAERRPRYELPFQQSQAVDIHRVSNILGVSKDTVIRLIKAKRLRGYQVPGSRRWRIEYNSVVEYCEYLRLEYRISSRAVAPIPGRRYRDEDLLPFPLSETIGIADVRKVLDCDNKPVQHMIDEGTLIAYQIWPGSELSQWRIYRRSLERLLETLRRDAAPAPLRRNLA